MYDTRRILIMNKEKKLCLILWTISSVAEFASAIIGSITEI